MIVFQIFAKDLGKKMELLHTYNEYQPKSEIRFSGNYVLANILRDVNEFIFF